MSPYQDGYLGLPLTAAEAADPHAIRQYEDGAARQEYERAAAATAWTRAGRWEWTLTAGWEYVRADAPSAWQVAS